MSQLPGVGPLFFRDDFQKGALLKAPFALVSVIFERGSTRLSRLGSR